MALSKDDLMALWRSSVDEDFARALLEGSPEVIEVSAEIMAAASDAIEQTTQGFYLRPHSSQTYPPAAGGHPALVNIVVDRAPPAQGAIVLAAATFIVEEQAVDAGDDGAELVATGRRYKPDASVVLSPGVIEVTQQFHAERAGDGYNLPLEDSIILIDDAGSAAGDSASVVPGTGTHRLYLSPTSETVSPFSVGQYVALTSGANAGQRRLVIGYESPDPNFPHNGILDLAASTTLAVSTVVGTFIPGEIIEQVSTGAAATLLGLAPAYLVAVRIAVPAFTAASIRGVQSGATATVTAVLESPAMVAESGTAGWELLSWMQLGVTVTNPARPAGGSAPTLDHIGEERTMLRASGELDEPYRKRLYARPDVDSPNALIRAMNRVLAPYGLTGCLREPSDLDTFQGFFFDAPANGPEARRYAYDLDFVMRPQDRYKLILDLAEYRGFFIAAIPPMSLGEFGFGFDDGGVPFFDAAPYPNFFDGYAVDAAKIRVAVWKALNGARLGGVGFELVEDRAGC